MVLGGYRGSRRRFKFDMKELRGLDLEQEQPDEYAELVKDGLLATVLEAGLDEEYDRLLGRGAGDA